MKSSLIAVLVFLATYSFASASPFTYGYGVQSCGFFVENSRLKVANVHTVGFMAFAGGYLSAYSRHNDSKDTDIKAAQIWLENYCQDHPLENFAEAVNLLAAELKRR